MKFNIFFFVSSFSKMSQMKWRKRKIIAMKPHPKRPFTACSTEDGRICLINGYDPFYIMILEDIPLTRNPLDAIRFGKQSNDFCVSCTSAGEFFLLRVSLKLFFQ